MELAWRALLVLSPEDREAEIGGRSAAAPALERCDRGRPEVSSHPVFRVLERTLDVFTQERVDCAVMGGFAVRHWGLPRPTYDVDFAVALEGEALVRLMKAFDAAGAGEGPPPPPTRTQRGRSASSLSCGRKPALSIRTGTTRSAPVRGRAAAPLAAAAEAEHAADATLGA
jgi:hypothetical protein